MFSGGFQTHNDDLNLTIFGHTNHGNRNSKSYSYTDFDRASQQLLNNVISDPDSRAIVPVEAPENKSSTAAEAVTMSRRRCKDLVRVTDFELKEMLHFRSGVRRTRILYNSLVVEDESKRTEEWRRKRGDLKALQLMGKFKLWLHRERRIVGHIPGICIGDVFLYRAELCVVGLHQQLQAGIDYLPSRKSSNGEPIATSVIVSGG